MRCSAAGRRRRSCTSPTAASSTRSTSCNSLHGERAAVVIARTLKLRQPSALPGFGLALGYALFYLTLIVLIPLAALVWRSLDFGVDRIIQTIATPRVLGALQVSFGTAFCAALVNLVFGLLVAW